MARVKAEERLLSWHEVGRCWKKFYRGRMYYLDPRKITRSDDSAYRQALKNWQRKKSELDASPHVEPEQDKQAAIDAAIAAAFGSLPSYVDPATLAAMNLSGAMGSGESHKPGRKLKTVNQLITAFIESKRAERDAGQIGGQMFVEYEGNVKFFGLWCEQPQIQILKVEQITATTLDAYRTFILSLKNPKIAESVECRPLGDVAIQKRLARLKQLVEWSYEKEHIEHLPRNLKSFARIKNGNGGESHKTDESFWTVEEAREMYSLATPKMRLYLCLAANCGYCQSDIASLEHSMIDWEEGVVNRLRHKTSAVQVHLLWPITLKLLKEQATKPDKSKPGRGLVLLSEKGNPLIEDKKDSTARNDACKLSWALLRRTMVLKQLRETQPELFALAKRAGKNATPEELKEIELEKELRADRIKQAVRAELQKEKRSFRHFRHSSSNAIAKQYGNGSHIVSQFLGHQEQKTLRHYTKEHHAELFTAIRWLESQYDFESVR